MITVGSDFSGVGAFNQALSRLNLDYKEIFACDMDKYARQTFIDNYGEPEYYPENVYDREIPKEPLDIYMTSPPCQGFSMAGKREGSVLFYNSHEFIQKNKPRYFIFENVKGLLSHENGITFQTWIDYLGGKSVNGNPVIFPRSESVPYHIFHKVINAKKCGVPQNRERIFIVGIRDDVDAVNFKWDKDVFLEKRLKDVLESDVPEKYFLSDKAINRFTNHDRSIGFKKPEEYPIANCVISGYYKMPGDALYLKIKSATNKGEDIKIGAIRGRNPQNPKSRKTGLPTEQQLEINENGTSNALTTVQKDNVVVQPVQVGKSEQFQKTSNVIEKENQEAFCLRASQPNGVSINYKIRRLTPRECFRLMDFPETFKMPCSDSQMYKQAGNSIVVACLVGIIKNFNL